MKKANPLPLILKCDCGYEGEFDNTTAPMRAGGSDRGEFLPFLHWKDYPAFKCPKCDKVRFSDRVEEHLAISKLSISSVAS
ncbi:MAG: hypothetical protein FWB73_00245 [Treponema sp.]|nr:hypothetical protein [Treponema sp.]